MKRGFLSGNSKGTAQPGSLAARVTNIDGSKLPSKSILKKTKVSSDKTDPHGTVSGVYVRPTVNEATESAPITKVDGHGVDGIVNGQLDVHANIQTYVLNSDKDIPTSFAEVLNAVGKSRKESSGMSWSDSNMLHYEKVVNFRLLVNEENMDKSDCVLLKRVADVVKCKYENNLVGYFVGKTIAFPLVQNYVYNTWTKFGLQKLMKTDDGVFLFKFASKEGLEQVLQRGPWMIRSSPLLLSKWSSTLSLKKGEVTKVPMWVKLYNVPILAYSGDGLSLIATQIGKPIMLFCFLFFVLDAFTWLMCVDHRVELAYLLWVSLICSDSSYRR
ncbi:putative reverse transcriptase domain-containing protein [Tanacetum coccineum]